MDAIWICQRCGWVCVDYVSKSCKDCGWNRPGKIKTFMKDLQWD